MAINPPPKTCLHCGQLFHRRENERLSDFKKKKFCDRSCSASYNGRMFPRKITISPTGGILPCQRCSAPIQLKRAARGGYYKRKYCDSCLKRSLSEHGTTVIAKNTKEYQAKRINVLSLTKAELFSRRKNWQSARTSIRNHASRIYLVSGGRKQCAICGYSLHIEICHRKPVSQFSDHALISEINAFSNLIALCPNHHWELDNGLLLLKELDAGLGVAPSDRSV